MRLASSERGQPPKEEGRSAKAARLQTSINTATLPRNYAAVNLSSAQTRWQQEGRRLLAEFRRTGNPTHLNAFRVHRAATGGRLHGRAVIR